MGWSLKIRETKKYGVQYKIWSSTSDTFITKDWQSRDEVIKFLFWSKFRDFAQNFIEDSMTFPNGFSDKDTYRRLEIDEKKSEEWYTFIKSTFKVDGNEKFFNKFNEILDQYEIKLEISDGVYKIGNLK